MKNDKVKFLIGTQEDCIANPMEPFNQNVCEFLDQLSKELRNDKEAKHYPDVLSFAFWCRKGNIKKLKEQFDTNHIRMGRGIVYHIAPSNVPVNFAFSLVFGLLSGNSNIVRVSSKKYMQVDILCRCIEHILEDSAFKEIKKQIKVVSYERDKEITDYFSAGCDARIIWGGDDTIEEIRRSPISTRTVEINFADRYSFGIINPEKILQMSEEEIRRLAQQFYNDTYLMDQNACSCPHLIVWLKAGDTIKAKTKFWDAVYREAVNYDLADIKVSDKYTSLCEYAVKDLKIQTVKRYDNLLYIIGLQELPQNIHELRGKYGEFFEMEIDTLEELASFISPKIQSCMICGVTKEEVQNFILNNHLRGIDRIVPFGSSLDIGTLWDGYDIINYLTRVIA